MYIIVNKNQSCKLPAIADTPVVKIQEATSPEKNAQSSLENSIEISSSKDPNISEIGNIDKNDAEIGSSTVLNVSEISNNDQEAVVKSNEEQRDEKSNTGINLIL